MQREVKPATTLQNMTQEDVFSVLGFTADCDPSPENEDSEKSATSGQSCVKEKSSECGNSLTNCIENTSNSETNGERKGGGTSSAGNGEVNDVSDANASTTDDVDIPVQKVNDACNEKDEKLDKRIEEEKDTSLGQEISVTHDIKENGDKIEEVVILDDDDDEETTEAQNSCGKKSSDSKIGKISIKKLEDLCEASAKKEKDSGSNAEKSKGGKMSISDESKLFFTFVSTV